jgi:Mg2+ and Co2+ transporter CorA
MADLIDHAEAGAIPGQAEKRLPLKVTPTFQLARHGATGFGRSVIRQQSRGLKQSRNVMSNSVAIVCKTTTLSITYVEKPSDEERRKRKEAGYRYENGNWFKYHLVGNHADSETIANLLAA